MEISDHPKNVELYLPESRIVVDEEGIEEVDPKFVFLGAGLNENAVIFKIKK